MEGDGAAGVAPDTAPDTGAAGVAPDTAPDTGAAPETARTFRFWRDGALIAAGWVVLTAFVFVPAFQILGLVLIPVIATLLVRGGGNA